MITPLASAVKISLIATPMPTAADTAALVGLPNFAATPTPAPSVWTFHDATALTFTAPSFEVTVLEFSIAARTTSTGWPFSMRPRMRLWAPAPPAASWIGSPWLLALAFATPTAAPNVKASMVAPAFAVTETSPSASTVAPVTFACTCWVMSLIAMPMPIARLRSEPLLRTSIAMPMPPASAVMFAVSLALTLIAPVPSATTDPPLILARVICVM